MQEQATSLLITQLIQAGLGAVSLVLLVYSFGPRLKRVSSRVVSLVKRVRRIELRLGMRVTPPLGVPVVRPPTDAPADAAEDFDDDTKA